MSHRFVNLGLMAGIFGSGALACGHAVESPKLTVQSVGPDLVCNAQRLQSELSVALSGTNFTPMPSNVLAEPAALQLPTVGVTRTGELTGDAASDAPVIFSGDPAGDHAGHLSWQSGQQMSLRITEPSGDDPGIELPAGLYDVQVTNPDGKTLEQMPRSLAVVDPPTISGIQVSDSSATSPLAVCTDQQSRQLTVSGRSFLSIDGVPPRLTLGGQAAKTLAMSSCQSVPGTYAGGQVQLCSSLGLTLGQGEFPPGTHSVVVTSNDPASCASSEPEQIVVVPAPLVSRVVPAAICLDQSDQAMSVEGGSFAVIGNNAAQPTVTVIDADGTASTFQPDSVDGCAAPDGTDASFGLQLCNHLVFTLPSGRFDPGTYSLRVTNPDPVGCTSTAEVDFNVNAPPRVQSVQPGSVCSGGSVVVAQGTGLVSGATAHLACAGGTGLDALLTSASADGTQLSMTFGPGVQAGQSCQVVVQNPDGCQDRPLPHQVVVGTEGPVLFNADPNVTYDAIDTKVNLFVTALQPPFTVTMWPSGSAGAAPITLAAALAPGKTTELQATVPAGTAAGDYDVAVNDGSGCAAAMQHAITVTDNLSIHAGLVTPPFGQDSASQALTIVLGSASSATGIPRAFLNPANSAAAAVQLQSVTPVNSTTLTALAPANTPEGVYDVVLVWPDGSVAVLDSAFSSVSSALPVITDAVPQSLVNASGQNLQLRGTGFSGSEVSLRCKTGSSVTTIAATTNSTESCGGSPSTCTQDVVFDTSSVPTGTVCVARATNADGVYAEFSAIGITNSSYNLSAPQAGQALITGRRALASSAVQATSAARFVYAIGGDTGSVAGALGSVEFAPVDVFGNMSPWVQSRQALPAARSFAADATLGRYVYVFGGNSGSGSVKSGARALVLSPEEVPGMGDVDLCLLGGSTNCFTLTSPGAGLEPGNYSYRVAAVIDAADPVNLGGETLASDPLILRLQGAQDRHVAVKFSWTAPRDSLGATLGGITGYRVYRTPKDGAPGSDEQLLATVGTSTLTFIDDGTATLTDSETPLPQGSTSAWQALPDLNTAREGSRGLVAQDPSDPTKWYVYSLLGRTDSSSGLTSYEYLPVTLAANGRQTLANAWTTGSNHSAVGRWQHGGWAIDSVDSQFVSGSASWIYVGGGFLADGTTHDGTVEAGAVQAGGEIGTFADVTNFTVKRVGYGTAGAANQLFIFGGIGNAASALNTASSSALASPAPDNGNWNSEGLSLTHARYLFGSPIQSAFIFMIAGDTTGSGSVTNTTETVVW
jgi:hypothetical protein